MKNISILGSTGSIGTQTLDVISGFTESFNIVGLSAGKNIDLLYKQIKQFNPSIVSVIDESSAQILANKLKSSKTEVLFGEEGAISVACHPKTDLVVSAMVGASGLIPTLSAIRSSKDIALANKETLVMAGKLITEEANKYNVTIFPVDSEHSAIFQLLSSSEKKFLKRIIITASGGPFLDTPFEKLHNISVESALNHPTWKMGRKITIDSATLMNKAFEVIEAKWLFDVTSDMISVWIHPQSIIHSIVEFVDGSMISQMSLPDMKIPISYALTYPDRLNLNINNVNPNNFSCLEFKEVDYDKFPSINLAFRVLEDGGTLSAVMNASNEIAVNAFLERKIGYIDIVKTVERVMNCHSNSSEYNLEQILYVDECSREKTKQLIYN